jgi:hypothetical protein
MAIPTIEVGNALKADIERPGLKCREVPIDDIDDLITTSRLARQES